VSGGEADLYDEPDAAAAEALIEPAGDDDNVGPIVGSPV
jgi:hypothetical protein